MEDEIMNLYDGGFAIEEIADELGISESEVLRVLEKNDYL